MVDKNPRKEMNRLQGENRKREVYPDDESVSTETVNSLNGIPSEEEIFFNQTESEFKERLIEAFGLMITSNGVIEHPLVKAFMDRFREVKHGKDKLPQDSNSLSTRP